MNNQKQDSIIAQQIISNSYNNFYGLNTFHDTSVIYKKSNERIECYREYLNNRKNILSVIASGDQIINCILGGAKEIDAFDISVFPKYFLFLKLAAIINLTKEQYCDFFYNKLTTSEKYDDYYEKIRNSLNKNNQEFWDSLFDYFPWFDIYNSMLFSTEVMIKDDVIRQNLYLQDRYYEKLKSMINDVKINTYDGNIFTLIDIFNKKYDLVYLSNIINYNDIFEYKNLLKKINLEDNGIVLTYLFSINNKLKDYFSDCYFEEFDGIRTGIMVYKK